MSAVDLHVIAVMIRQSYSNISIAQRVIVQTGNAHPGLQAKLDQVQTLLEEARQLA